MKPTAYSISGPEISIGYADGRRDELYVADQSVPFHVLRELWTVLAIPIGADARS